MIFNVGEYRARLRGRAFARLGVVLLACAIATTSARAEEGTPEAGKSLQRQVADAMIKAAGDVQGFRLAHAKGIVCLGTFEPTPEAAALSKAAHFRGEHVPVLVRFSDGTGLPNVADADPRSNPKGCAIRFNPGSDASTDIVANGRSGFVASTPEEFTAFITAAVASPPNAPHPTPLETFLASHPQSAKFLAGPNPTPASFATQKYFGNDAFVFVNAEGHRQPFRYQIVPVAGEQALDAADAAKRPADFLFDEIRERLAKAPVEFRLMAQLPNPGDPTNDIMKVWPDDRKLVLLGTIRLVGVDPKSDQTQRDIALDPTNLADGIELSDDPLPAFRSKVYALSVRRRQK